MNNKNMYGFFKHWRDFRLQLFFEGIVVGLAAGVVVVLFRVLLEMAENYRVKLYNLLSHPFSIFIWFVVLLGVALVLAAIIRKEPMAGGSGIPQVKGVLLGYYKMNWFRILVGKFFGGILAIGAGLSLGREGPSIQLGATIGQGISRMLGRLRIEEKYLITSGSSAGLAAAFNAPLAGVVFALEELHKSFSPIVLTSAMAASLTADFVASVFLGQKPIFDFRDLPILPFEYYFYLIILGLVIGVLGAFFNWFLIKSLDFYSCMNRLPSFVKPTFPLLIGGILGFVLPEVLGGGNNLITSLGENHYGLYMLLLLLLAKFLFTMLSYGSGVPGGIFLPMLVIGALAGDIYGQVAAHYFNMNPQYVQNFIVFAMAAYFTAVVKAPVTGIILIMEMTGSFGHMYALMTVSMTAYIVSDVLKSKPVYDILLERSLASSRKKVYNGEEKPSVILESVVCLGSKVSGKYVKDIDWPAKCLIVGIRRGDSEIIPKGDSKILSGDTINILIQGNDVEKVTKLLMQMTGATE